MPLEVYIGAEPSTPATGYADLFLASADNRAKAKWPDGSVHTLSDIRAHNLLVNGGFWFAQRQTPGTLTTYSNTTGRSFAADQWALTNENASVQYARVDSMGAVETGLSARFYGQFKKITSTGKVIVSQVVEAMDCAPYRGRRVRFQIKARNDTGSHTLRMVLLQLTSAGTVDTIPATFASAFGAVGTDPTWGTNLSAITPTIANSNSSISGSGISCTLTSSWRRYGGIWTLPSDYKNLIAVVFTNNQPVANDILDVAEAGMYEGDEEREHMPLDYTSQLLRCQRFYTKTFNVETAPATAVGSGTGELRGIGTAAGAVAQRPFTWTFPVTMHHSPTVGTANVTQANAQIRDFTAAADCTGTTSNVSERSAAFSCTGAAGTLIGNSLTVHAVADAGL